jgi:hypothetical protein
MPDLKWNEQELIECLGVLPETDEFYCSHRFKLNLENLRLDLTLWQYESLVSIELYNEPEESPFVSLCFIVRDRIAFMNEKNTSALGFYDCAFVDGRFWRIRDREFDLFGIERLPVKLNLLLSTYPKIEFKAFDRPER